MSTTASQANSVVCKAIDEEITQLLEAIRQLRSKRNTLIPISCLPTEILLRIFNSVVEKHGHNWTSFSRVSQQWRTIALAAPNLWSEIAYGTWGNSAAVDVFLKRSACVPLSIDVWRQSHEETIHTILTHLPRIHTLKLSIASMDDGLHTDLAKPAPLLEICQLYGNSGHLSQDVAEAVLFGGGAPRLTSLSIRSFPVNLQGFVCESLTHLKLSFEPRTPCRIPITTLLGLVHHTEFLHTLELEFGFVVSANTIEPSLPFVTLPNLQVFKVKADPQEISLLLPRLSIPLKARVQLYAHIPQAHANRPNPQEFLDLVGNHLDRGSTYKEVAIYAQEPSELGISPSIRFVFWVQDGSLSGIQNVHHMDVSRDYKLVKERNDGESELDGTTSIEFVLNHLTSDERSMWECLVEPRQFQTTEVTHLRLRFVPASYEDRPQSKFERILSLFPSVTSLLLDNEHVVNAFSALIVSNGSNPNRQESGHGSTSTLTRTLAFPCLERLCVHLSPFNAARQINAETLEALHFALQHRNQAGGRKLEEFILVGVNLQDGHEADPRLIAVCQGITEVVVRMVSHWLLR